MFQTNIQIYVKSYYLLKAFSTLDCTLCHFICVRLFVTPWTVAHQAPLSMGFSWQEHWSRLPCPPPGDLPDPGTEPESPASPALQADSLPAEPSGKRTLDQETGLNDTQFSSVALSCPTLCDPIECSLPGPSVHGILQARILERVAMPFPRGSFQPRD